MTLYSNQRQGRFAAEFVADEYDLDYRPDEADWYDCVNPRTGTKYEVKSTDGGRFRLWEDQIRSLRASDARGTAWVAFVLLDGGNVVDLARKEPATVAKIVAERSGWNRAGHEKREGRQYKLPEYTIF